MFGYIIQHKNEKRVVISTRAFIVQAIFQFLHDVYNCNDIEVRVDFSFSYEDKTWQWGDEKGTFEPISIITA